MSNMLNTILQTLIERSNQQYMMITNKTAQTLKSTNTIIKLENVSCNTNLFTLSNGGIAFDNSKVKHIEVSGCLYINEGLNVNDLIFVSICNQSSTQLFTAGTVRSNYQGAVQIPLAPYIIPTDGLTRINLSAYNGTAARGNVPAYFQTRLCIRKID